MRTVEITVRNDPRVLPVGRILRKTKINELPQLINVLKGDMTLIGPRPLPRKNFDCYSDEIKAIVTRIRPGLSGVGSLVFRHEEAVIANSGLPPEQCYKQHIAPYKGELEAWYAEHQSISLDLLLVCLTIWVVFAPKGRRCVKLLRGLPQPDSAVLAACFASA